MGDKLEMKRQDRDFSCFSGVNCLMMTSRGVRGYRFTR